MTNAKRKSLIVPKNNPILRKVAKAVPAKDIGSKKLNDILQKMSRALHAEEDGVAIAAPQIGVGLRIFLVNTETLRNASKSKTSVKNEGGKADDLVFINPEITKLSRKKSMMEEGCLSVRWLYGKVERSQKATIQAFDENGKRFEKGASGLLAQIFQHEVDHLNGVLFIDKAVDLEDLPPADEAKL